MLTSPPFQIHFVHGESIAQFVKPYSKRNKEEPELYWYEYVHEPSKFDTKAGTHVPLSLDQINLLLSYNYIKITTDDPRKTNDPA